MILRELFASKKILVVGDSILDRYVYGKVTRVSPEAPVPVVVKQEEKIFPGGAANVAQNVVSLGAEVHLLSICGDDENGEILQRICQKKKIAQTFIIDSRPTTTKIRIIGNNHQIARIDEERTHPIENSIEDKIFSVFQNLVSTTDLIILQDYGKGIFNESLSQRIIKEASRVGVEVIVDPKDKNLKKFRGSFLIKPNLSELKLISGIHQDHDLSEEQIVEISRNIIKQHKVSMVLVTLSENGMILVTAHSITKKPGLKIEVSDVSGAGDTVSATLGLCLASGVSNRDCVAICNLAGSIVCQFSGAVPINSKHLFDQLAKISPLLESTDGSAILI